MTLLLQPYFNDHNFTTAPSTAQFKLNKAEKSQKDFKGSGDF